jgi:CHAT domain-containing protein
MTTARRIHLATHGLLDDLGNSGMPGAIALAPTAQDSGLLTAQEVMNLRLAADLVVLSACNTGRGRITGDGVLGLSRAFLAAGARSVIVTLWKIPDEPTAMLMHAFYEALNRGESPARALRQALLQLRDRYPSPFNWAAFVPVGDVE